MADHTILVRLHVSGTGSHPDAKLDLEYDTGPWEGAEDFNQSVSPGETFEIKVNTGQDIKLSGIKDCTGAQNHVIAEITAANAVVAANGDGDICFSIVTATPAQDLLESFQIGYYTPRTSTDEEWEDPKMSMRGSSN